MGTRGAHVGGERERAVAQLPPGPLMPSSLQALGWAARPLPFLDRCMHRYGSTFTLRVRRGRPWVILANPRDVKLVFTADAQTQTAGAVEANPALEPLLGRRSVMLRREPEHMHQRKLMLPSFHGERMDGYDRLIVETTRREIAGWPEGERFALWPRMQRISSAVIMRAVFGTVQTPNLKRLRVLMSEMTEWLNSPRRLALMTVVGPRWLTHNGGFKRVMEPVEVAVLEEVRRRRASPGAGEGDDILSMLLSAYDEDGSPMTEHELRDELLTLLSDGPTATSLAWAFERLLRHPDKLARLREEVAGDGQDAYADAVVKETLRLCPIVPLIMRKLLAPMEIEGFAIPAGATVAPCAYLIHHRGDIYTDPHSFKPERFLGRAAPAYAWIPFGGGVRRCLAAGFAQLTIKRVIQTVLSEIDLQAVTGGAVEGAARSSVAFVPAEQALAIVPRHARRRRRAQELDAGAFSPS